MNLNIIKNEINNNLNRQVKLYVHALRNKSYYINGVITKLYPNLFIVYDGSKEHSITYSDVASGDVKITYI